MSDDNRDTSINEDERVEDEYVNEEDAELYEDELEQLDIIDEPEGGAEVLEDDEVGYPENLTEDDLEDSTTEYTEAEFHDEQRTREHEVEDLDLGEALYYEKDLDYRHMDGEGFEADLKNLEDDVDFGDGEAELRDEDEEAAKNPGSGAEKPDSETSGG